MSIVVVREVNFEKKKLPTSPPRDYPLRFSCGAILVITYLSRATEAEAKVVVKMGDG